MNTRKLEVVVYQEDDGYVAQCLNVNVASEGATEADALANLHEALELYFEDEDQLTIAPVARPRLTELTLQSA
jgi:predicted RNase H-like HicB family nuclease